MVYLLISGDDWGGTSLIKVSVSPSFYNNDIAAARVELSSSSTNAKYAERSSTNYILCEK